MTTLILVEHDNKHMHTGTMSVVRAALAFEEPIHMLVVGYDCDAVAKEVAAIEGVSYVHLCDDPVYKEVLAENLATVMYECANTYDVLLAPATTFGKNILPRVAAMLDTAQLSEVSAIISKDTFEHPIYAGNAIETVQVFEAKKILSIRITAFDPISNKQNPAHIEKIDKKGTIPSVRFIACHANISSRPDLGHAERVVSGGRGLQSKENFALIDKLADALGAAVGASRAAVDAGFVSNDCQVGQTGKVVAPVLYIAIGISGAIQHIAGMKDSKVIVAINKDPEAPIFQIATYGLVGDLFEIVPEMIRLLNKGE
jgi:electron transfer flavoprotein alpha subunit